MFSVYFDSVISPFYNFGGLSTGNLYSMASKDNVSNPKKAALDGLKKMKQVYDFGQKQYILPPIRQNYEALLLRYFSYSDLNQAHLNSPDLFRAIFSSAGAWLANAWTQTPSIDSVTNKSYLRISNLASMEHRKMDVPFICELLNDVFDFNSKIVLTPPLAESICDEGMANMIRLSSYLGKGFYICVYGSNNTSKFKARHSINSWKRFVLDHHMMNKNVILVEQNPKAIDRGVFHNDIISFGMDSLLVLHEFSFTNQDYILTYIKETFYKLFNQELKIVFVSNSVLSIQDALSSYFFNSQLVKIRENKYGLICPLNCIKYPSINTIVSQINSNLENDLEVVYVDLNESVKNGGGPACLRNVCYFNSVELRLVNKKYMFSEILYSRLVNYIVDYYPETLSVLDLTSIKFVRRLNQVNDSIIRLFNS
jgi:succinylarginine dihydrolase